MRNYTITVTIANGDMTRTKLPEARPTRKQRFEAALKLAGLTVEQWRTELYPVSAQHLNEVWNGRREASAQLNAAIDAVIGKYLGDVA